MAKPFPLSILMRLEDRASGPLRRFTDRVGGPRVRGALGNFKGRLGAVGTALGAVAGGFALVGSAAAAGVGVLSRVALGYANTGDEIGKTADRLGLGVEALQELRFVADRSGVAAATFDMAYQRFARRIGEAAAGTGEARTAIDALGISLFDQNGQLRDSEDLFGEVADKLSTLENASVRNALAMKFFDSEGVALVQMMKDGSAGIADLREEARGLGLVMGEDLVRQSENVVDRWTNLTGRAKGLGFALAGPLLDMAERLFPALERAIASVQPLFERFASHAEGALPRIAGYVGEFADRVWKAVEPARELGGNLVKLFDTLESKYGVAKKFWDLFAWGAEKALWPVMQLLDGINWALEAAGLLDTPPAETGRAISEAEIRQEQLERQSPENREALADERQRQLAALERLGLPAAPSSQGVGRVRLELAPGLRGSVTQSDGLELSLDTGAMMPAGG